MNQRKILLLENVATQAAEVREHLSRAGYQVAIARYEADGLKRLLEWGPDLVLVSTAHPAGDFVEYCRRVRSLAPAVRIVVTSQFDSQQLFRAYPALEEIVDGVLPRPYSHEAVVTMLATAPVASGAPAADPVNDAADADLRAQFQRRLDEKFLEVEELRRGEIEARTRDLEEARGLLQALRESSDKAAEESAAFRSETERALVEKEQLEEKLHALQAARSAADALPVVSPEAELRVASLAAELSRQRAQAAEGQVALADMTAKAAVLEEELAREQADREARKQLLEELRARSEELSREIEHQRACRAEADAEKAVQGAEVLGRELAESRDRARERTAECERLTGMIAERERVYAEEVRTWRDKVEAAALEIRLLRSQEAERAGREAEERRTAAELQEQAGKESAERDRQIVSLREELAAAAGPGPVQAELRRIQELLEEVISRARTEAVDYARRDAELSVRLQAALDERRLLQERFERVSVEATERERRSSSLLQSAIERGASPPVERANLPAIVPLDPGRAAPRWWPILAGLAVAALVALLSVFGLRRTGPPAVRDQQPAAPRTQRGAPPGPGASPREIWERWTRSDSSGGVLVQATLRSEGEVRAEVEADRARGTDAELRAEIARRLAAFRFDTTYYVTVYLKNLAPGYPAYLDDLPGRFRLRDSAGREVPAFLPPGHETDRRIFTFGAGPPGDLIYEASVSLGFERAGLSPSAEYLQLVVSDVGAASRRVLTWELE